MAPPAPQEPPAAAAPRSQARRITTKRRRVQRHGSLEMLAVTTPGSPSPVSLNAASASGRLGYEQRGDPQDDELTWMREEMREQQRLHEQEEPLYPGHSSMDFVADVGTTMEHERLRRALLLIKDPLSVPPAGQTTSSTSTAEETFEPDIQSFDPEQETPVLNSHAPPLPFPLNPTMPPPPPRPVAAAPSPAPSASSVALPTWAQSVSGRGGLSRWQDSEPDGVFDGGETPLAPYPVPTAPTATAGAADSTAASELGDAGSSQGPAARTGSALGGAVEVATPAGECVPVPGQPYGLWQGQPCVLDTEMGVVNRTGDFGDPGDLSEVLHQMQAEGVVPAAAALLPDDDLLTSAHDEGAQGMPGLRAGMGVGGSGYGPDDPVTAHELDCLSGGADMHNPDHST